MATKQQVNEFFNQMANACSTLNMGTLFPSVAMAQSAVESGYGQTLLARQYNNYFGIKSLGKWTGKSINMQTREVVNNTSVTIKSNFRVYDSMRESIADRNTFLKSYSRYKPILEAKTPVEQIKALGESGYATSPNYATAILNVYNTYNLSQYDDIVKKKRIVKIALLGGLIVICLTYKPIYNGIKKIFGKAK